MLPASGTGAGEPGPGIRVLWRPAFPCAHRPECHWCIPQRGMCDRPVGQAECHRLSFASALEVSGSACGSFSRLRLLSSPVLPKGWVMSLLCSPACSQPLSGRVAAKGFMGVSILFGSLGAASISSWFPALSCQGHTLTCSAATLAHSHSAQAPCSQQWAPSLP